MGGKPHVRKTKHGRIGRLNSRSITRRFSRLRRQQANQGRGVLDKIGGLLTQAPRFRTVACCCGQKAAR